MLKQVSLRIDEISIRRVQPLTRKGLPIQGFPRLKNRGPIEAK